ncbi:MAG: hypothetical protein AAF495_03660 [Pseudomonadota bacterium]
MQLSEAIRTLMNQMILDSVHGDLSLRLRQSSLSGRQDVLFARNIRGKISLGATFEENRFILIPRFGERRTEKVADIRAKIAIEPCREAEPALDRDVGVYVALPGFLSQAQNERQLEIKSSPSPYWVLRDVDEIKYARLGSTGASPFHNVEPSGVFMILRALADWAREEENQAPLRLQLPTPDEWGELPPGQADGQPRLVKLLNDIKMLTIHAVSILNLDLAAANDDPESEMALDRVRQLDQDLLRLHPHFGSPYRFESLRADILVKLDRNGEVVTRESKEDGVQFDLRGALNREDSDRINLALKLTDLLVKGPFFEQFADFLQGLDPEQNNPMGPVHELLESLTEHFPRGGGGSLGDLPPAAIYRMTADELLMIIDQARKNDALCFVRMSEGEENDTEAIWMRAHHDGAEVDLLFEATVKVERFPEVRLKKLFDAKLLMVTSGDESWPKASVRKEKAKYIGAFFERFFSTLLVWQGLASRGGRS